MPVFGLLSLLVQPIQSFRVSIERKIEFETADNQQILVVRVCDKAEEEEEEEKEEEERHETLWILHLTSWHYKLIITYILHLH
jgi:hypothetical protein